MSSLTKYREMKAKMDEARKEATAIAKDAFREGAEALFAKHPLLRSFGWTQYTPYFNDGDACTFSTNTDCPTVNGYDEYGDGDEDEEEDEEEEREPSPEVSDKDHEAMCKAVSAFLANFTDDDFEEMFGNHVRVTIRRNAKEASVEEYSHD